MRIKYISCDGETEVEEEIIYAEFYWDTTTRQFEIQAKRPNGDMFTVPIKRVEYITKKNKR